MRPNARRTNLGLAFVVPAALATGALAFATGSAWVRWIAVAHAVAASAIVVVSPWKTAIARRRVRRRRASSALAAVALGVSVVVTVVTGLLHSTGVLRTLGPASAMQLHVASALASVPLFLWHLVARPVRPRRTDVSRRAVLAGAAVGTASVASYGALTFLANELGLRGVERRATGSYEIASLDPGRLPVTQWLDDSPPPSGVQTLTVDSGGAVRRWSLAELSAFDDAVNAVLDCTGGWYSAQEWRGVRLSRLLSPDAEATSVLVRSQTGYTRRFPITDAPHLLLALRVGGRPLSVGHGAPMRIVAPGRRGFWWVKWVASIRTDDVPWWWQPPFPLS